MPKLSVEEIKDYVKNIKLFWGRFHKSVSKPYFPSGRKDVCAIGRRVAENVSFKEGWRNNIEVACFKKSYEASYDEILLVWKTKDGDIEHCTIISNAFGGDTIFVDSIKECGHDKIRVNIFFDDNDRSHYSKILNYTYSPWKEIPPDERAKVVLNFDHF